MLKVDITMTGCGPNGGLTLGIVQSESGVHVVGLGDQFTAAEGPTPAGLEEVVALTEHILGEISHGAGAGIVLQDTECEADFGSAETCRRMFHEIPDERTLERYQQLLSSCEATPAYALAIVAFWLRDESGTTFQGLARIATNNGRLTLTEPLLIASGF